MEFEEALKMVYSACEKMRVRSDYTEKEIIKSATKIYIAGMVKPEKLLDNENMRAFLEDYKDFLLVNIANQREYNAKIEVVNDIKLYLDGRFEF